MKIKRPDSLQGIIQGLLPLFSVLLIFTGSGLTAYASEKLLIIAMLILGGFVCRTPVISKNIYSKKYITIFGVIFIFLIFNYLNSYNHSVTQSYLLRFMVFSLFLLFNLNIELQYNIIFLVRRVATIISIAYIICWPFQGADGGLLQNYQYTAQTLSLALGFYIPDVFDQHSLKIKKLFPMGLIFLAIILTGKRTLFIIPIMMVFVIALLSDDYRKFRKLFFLGLLSIIIISILYFISSDVMSSINRLLDTSKDATMNSRSYFWAYALMLWKTNPLYGIGFGCFPAHIATGGVNLADYGYIQAYAAHNIYYQMLAEIGVVGLILFCIFYVIGIIDVLKVIILIKKRHLEDILPIAMISFYCQMWFLIYGITGNPLYMISQLYILFLGISFNISIINYLVAEGSVSKKRVVLNIPELSVKMLKPLIIFVLVLGMIFGIVSYLDYTSAMTDDVDRMIAKAEYFWKKGKTDLALIQLNIYCNYKPDDKASAITLAEWYSELGDENRALLWYQNATYADIDKEKNEEKILLTAKDNAKVAKEISDCITLVFEPSVIYTRDVELNIYSENLFNGYEEGKITSNNRTLIKNKTYRTCNWFPVDTEAGYLTMYGSFNMAIWQFADKNGKCILTYDASLTENGGYSFREQNNIALTNLPKSVVEIPTGASFARITYYNLNTISESAEMENDIYITHGKGIMSDIASNMLTIKLPDLNDGEKIIYENKMWKLFSSTREELLDLPVITVKEGNVLEMKGTLLGIMELSYKGTIVDQEKKYGVRWNTEENNLVCERVGDSIGLHFNYMIGDKWANMFENDFDNIYPWSDIRLCSIAENDKITYIDNNLNTSKNVFEDIYVEIPKFYVKREIVDQYEYIWISGNKKEGFEIDPAFMTKNGVQDHIYIAAYQSSLGDSGEIRSVSNAFPAINLSISELRVLTQEKNPNYGEMDMTTLMMLQRLFIVETGIKNSQALFSGITGLNFFNADEAQCAIENAINSNSITISKQRGFEIGDAVTVITKEEWDNFQNIEGSTQRTIKKVQKDGDGNYYIEFSGEPLNIKSGETYIYNIPRKTGDTDKISYCTGVVSDELTGKEAFKYRFIENLWGNGATLLDGAFVTGTTLSIQYPNGEIANINYNLPVQENLPGFANIIPSETIVKELGFDEENPYIMFPTVIGNGASFTDAFGDTYYLNGNTDSEEKFIAYGGAWDVKNYAGFFNYRIQLTVDSSAKENSSRMIYRN